jgi:hypothetical protein
VKRAVWLTIALLATFTAASATADARVYYRKAFWGPLTVNGVSQFPVYNTLGVGIYQMDLYWAATAPERPGDPTNPKDPVYKWPASISYAVAQAKRYKMRVLLQVIQTPSWANGGKPTNWVPTRNSDLANFVTAASRRYPSVHLWMIWGEPDRSANFEPLVPAAPNATKLTPAQAAAPHKYAQMLDASYGALKKLSRRNFVIGGNTTFGDIPTRLWVENMRLPNKKPPRMDLYGHNPFSTRAPNLNNPPSPDGAYDFSDLARLEQLVNKNLAPRGHQLKLFLSEWSVPTAPNTVFDYYTSPAVQAQWITDAWHIVRSSPFISALGWINLSDDPTEGEYEGLLYANGQPKPGYYAFAKGLR